MRTDRGGGTGDEERTIPDRWRRGKDVLFSTGGLTSTRAKGREIVPVGRLQGVSEEYRSGVVTLSLGLTRTLVTGVS